MAGFQGQKNLSGDSLDGGGAVRAWAPGPLGSLRDEGPVHGAYASHEAGTVSLKPAQGVCKVQGSHSHPCCGGIKGSEVPGAGGVHGQQGSGVCRKGQGTPGPCGSWIRWRSHYRWSLG